MPLSGNQRRFLRSLGHHLEPIVHVGHQGATEGVVKALQQALNDHELVKVKFNQNVDEKSEALEALQKGTGGECAQTLGRTALIYLAHPKKPVLKLPDAHKPPKAGPPPKAVTFKAPLASDAGSDDEEDKDEVDEDE
jgi:RNA-binding protein